MKYAPFSVLFLILLVVDGMFIAGCDSASNEPEVVEETSKLSPAQVLNPSVEGKDQAVIIKPAEEEQTISEPEDKLQPALLTRCQYLFLQLLQESVCRL